MKEIEVVFDENDVHVITKALAFCAGSLPDGHPDINYLAYIAQQMGTYQQFLDNIERQRDMLALFKATPAGSAH